MRKLLALMVLIIGMLLLSGYSEEPRPKWLGNLGSGPRMISGAAITDTITYLVQSEQYPNSNALAEGLIDSSHYYDVVIEANDGTALRYGYVQADGASGTVYATDGDYNYHTIFGGRAPEDNFTIWNPSQKLGFLWFSLGSAARGDSISGTLHFNAPPWGPITLSSGQYVAARVDTNDQHYTMLDTDVIANHAATDANRVGISWDYVDAHNSTAWSPALGDIHDWHDFGPRSDDVWPGPDTVAAGETISLDVSTALQQVVDAGDAARGVLFVIYGAGTNFNNTVQVATGNSSLMNDSNGKGNPCLEFTTVSRRGTKPFESTKVPVVLCLDDQEPQQPSLFTEMENSVDKVTFVVYGTSAISSVWDDSLYAIKPNKMDLIHHGYSHASYGTVTGNELDFELSNSWMDTAYAGLDTNSIVYTSWPGGGDPQKSIEALLRMPDLGYLGARATNMSSSPIGPDVPLRWEEPTSLYNIQAYAGNPTFAESGAPANKAEIKEQLFDYVDERWTDGKAAVIIYAHDYGREYLTPAGIASFVEIIDESDMLELRSFSSVLDARRRASVFAEVSDITFADSIFGSLNSAPYYQIWSTWLTAAGDTDPILRPGTPVSPSVYGGDGEVSLSWFEPSSGDGITEDYNIYRSVGGALADSILVDGADVKSGYVDTTVFNDVEYLYLISAADKNGIEGVPTASISVTPTSGATPPSVAADSSGFYPDFELAYSAVTAYPAMALHFRSKVNYDGTWGTTVSTDTLVTTATHFVPADGIATGDTVYIEASGGGLPVVIETIEIAR
jgi:hypothetical protein